MIKTTKSGMIRSWAMVGVAAFVLSACVEREQILPGERLDARDDAPLSEEDLSRISEVDPRPRKERYREARQKRREAIEAAKTPVGTLDALGETPGVSLPGQTSLANWTHKNCSVTSKAPHLTLRPNVARIWSTNIGAGNGRRSRISADPIVVDGRIFVMDSAALVTAVSRSGQVIWRRDLTPATEKQGSVSGGGLAYGGGRLIVTTGFAEVIALDPSSGNEFWRHEADAAFSSPPAVIGDTVVAVARNNQAFGLELGNGRIKWLQQSSSNAPGLLGASAPAATGRLVVLPFSSGEVIGVVPSNGARAWSTAVSGGGAGLAKSLVGDISGDPVIDGTTIYTGNQSGRLVAIDRRSGERLWTTNVGVYGPPLPVGGSVFIVSDDAHLVRINAADGSVIWKSQLPGFKKPRKRRTVYANYGPLLAGGRLLVASSDGNLYSFNPATGRLLSNTAVPGGSASQPAIVGNTLYLISGNGQLHAFQ